MNPEELSKAIYDIMQARSMEELEKVLNNHPELLGEEVDGLLGQLASTARQEGDTNAGNLFSQIRELLQTARASRESSRDESELSAILEELSRPARLVDMPKRIDLSQRALELVSREQNAELWAALQNELGNSLAQSPQGDRAENIERAIEHYSLALKIYTQKDFPNLCRKTAYNLGNLFLEVRRYSPAADAYIMGMEAAEELYRASIFQASREVELAETRDLYRRAGYALAKSNKSKDAAVALERGRARGLGDALARDRADLERIREKEPQTYKLYSQAVEELQNLESQERKGDSAEGKDLPPLRDLMRQARSRLDRALDRIRRIPGYESFLAEPGWEEIATAVVEGQPLVYIAAAPGGGVALIVSRSGGDVSVQAVDMDGLSEERLQEYLKTWFDAYGGWQEARQKLIADKIDAEEYLQAQSKWFDAIEAVTGQLWQEVAEPVYSALQLLKAEQAFLVPTGLLALLPLHAAWRDEEGKREYLQDLLPLSFIPSARALAHARRTASIASAEKLLAIDEPRQLKPIPLPNSHAEVLAISSHFHDPQILEHEKATHSAVLKALPEAQVAHFSCHGRANWGDPEQSGLLMARGEILTIKDLFELHLAGARLATLSACETGVPGTRVPDEVVSLPSAFIRAGFAGAIGSLWTVSEKSTAMLMTRFYQIWQTEGKQPVQALAEAQRKLREDERFRHPFYWAAFYMTGV
jgi:CHAT domain-containing protein